MMVTIRSSSSELSSPALRVSERPVSEASAREVMSQQQPASIQAEYLTTAILTHTPSGLDLPLVEINISLLADQVGVSSSNTLDLGQGDHDLSSTLDVGVEETENVLLVSSERSERDNRLRSSGERREYKRVDWDIVE
jgi:hypothetical protein